MAEKFSIIKKLILLNVALLLIFCAIYSGIELTKSGSFLYAATSQKLEIFDMCYFSVIVHSTVGFGDIIPVNWYAKVAVCVHVVLVVCLNLAYIWFSIQDSVQDQSSRIINKVIDLSRQAKLF